MSEYLSKKVVLDKKAMLDWHKERIEHWKKFRKTFKDGSHSLNETCEVRIDTHQVAINLIQSGRFDADNSEVQRLRVENERYRKALERIAETDIPYASMTEHSVFRFYEQVAREALASTPTEPSGAEGDGNDA